MNNISKRYFELVSMVIKGAVEMPRGNNRLKVIEINKEFACSKLLKIYCDCSYNFEYNKLSQWIVERNEEMEEMIKNGEMDRKRKLFGRYINK